MTSSAPTASIASTSSAALGIHRLAAADDAGHAQRAQQLLPARSRRDRDHGALRLLPPRPPGQDGGRRLGLDQRRPVEPPLPGRRLTASLDRVPFSDALGRPAAAPGTSALPAPRPTGRVLRGQAILLLHIVDGDVQQLAVFQRDFQRPPGVVRMDVHFDQISVTHHQQAVAQLARCGPGRCLEECLCHE